MAALQSGVLVSENNPCFEFWLLLHFRQTGRLFQNCEQVVTELGHFISGYQKGLKFLEATHLFSSLRERLPQAMANAARLEVDRADHDPLYPRAGVYKFLNGMITDKRPNFYTF